MLFLSYVFLEILIVLNTKTKFFFISLEDKQLLKIEMKKLLLSVLSLSTVALMAQIEGKWNCTFIGIGPSKGDFGWFNTGLNSTTRPCLADDEYVFNSDGSFENVLGTETWVETWQGAAGEGCAAPVAPHDGSNKGSWRYDATAGKLSIVGKGNFLGLAKVINGGELTSSAAAADSIVYEVAMNGNEMTVDISIKTADGTPAYWRFTMVKQTNEIITNPEGNWAMHFMGIGPNKGDVSWFNTLLDANNRPCLADDEYQFMSDGSFKNVLGTESWLEAWQGATADGCGTPVAPHDGSNTGSWKDNKDGTITINGKGNYLGIAKVINGGEINAPANAVDGITYEVSIKNDTMNVDIAIKTGDGTPAYWHFAYHKVVPVIETNPKGAWNMTFIGVGPSKGDVSWFNTPIDANNRPCLADDVYAFGDDGTFTNTLGTETWVEGWQGAATDGCGTPVAPHDGSNTGSWKDNMDGTVTVNGKGNYLGLAKVVNGGEIAAPADAPDGITYEVMVNNDTLIADIAIKTGDGTPGYWHYRFVRFSPTNSNNKINKNAISVYPNPANDVLWISNVELGAKVIVRSIDGRVVLNQTANGNAISVASLNQGTYLVEVHAQNGVATTKFIKN